MQDKFAEHGVFAAENGFAASATSVCLRRAFDDGCDFALFAAEQASSISYICSPPGYSGQRIKISCWPAMRRRRCCRCLRCRPWLHISFPVRMTGSKEPDEIWFAGGNARPHESLTGGVDVRDTISPGMVCKDTADQMKNYREIL